MIAYLFLGENVMAIFRVEHNFNYTVMSNVHFKEKEMSLKAKGLLSLMLSLQIVHRPAIE